MNFEGLKDVKELLNSINIFSWITGQNCDGSWYLTIRKEKELTHFFKQPSRKKNNSGDWTSTKHLCDV